MTEEEQSLKENESTKAQIVKIALDITTFLLVIVIFYFGYLLFTNYKTTRKAEKAVERVEAGKVFKLDILNGCGISGVGDRFTEYLRAGGIDVINSSNFVSFNVNETLVIDRKGDRENAEKVAGLLGIDTKNIISLVGDRYLLDVTIIIGRDFKKFKPYHEENKH